MKEFKRRESDFVRQGALSFANIVVILFILGPIIALILGSVQTQLDLYTNVMKIIPDHFTLKNYKALITGEEVVKHQPRIIKYFPTAFKNSFIIAISVVLLDLLLGLLSAYSFARIKFRGRKTGIYLLLSTRMIPAMIIIISLYILMRRYHLLNTLTGVILTLGGFLLPYVIWILTAYLQPLPSDLEDAARLDGCGRMGVLVRIIIPLSVPGIAACGTVIFMFSWIEFLIPFILGSKPEVMPLTVLTALCVTDFTMPICLLCAVGVYAIIPTVVIVLLMRKYVIEGLTSGALKG